MENKILSVSIAAYNVEKTLDETLKHFLPIKQKDKLEVLIINDGSKDNTAEVAQKYIDKFPDIFRIINKQNGGWGSTLNSGIKAATGKYFKQLDGDDYFNEGNMDNFIEYLEMHDADMIYSPFVMFDDKTGGVIKQLGSYNWLFKENELIYLDELEEFMPAMHTLTVRTEILKKSGIQITEHCFYTDLEFVLKAFNECSTMYYFDKNIYYYRVARDGQSMSVTGVRKHYKEHQKVLMTMIDYMNNTVKNENVKREFFYRLRGAAYLQYIFYMALPCNFTNKREIKEYDKLLKTKSPKIYKELYIHQPIKFWREHNFFLYYALAHYKIMQDKKRRINLFEGE